MPATTTATLTRDVPFPDDAGTPLWQERRSRPLVALYGAPAIFLALCAVAARPLLVQAGFALATALAVALLLRARPGALIETFTLSERYLCVVQPAGGRVAVPVEELTRVVLKGDRVQLEATVGIVTLGFVRRQGRLLRALRQVAPALPVERDGAAFCPT